MIYKKFSESISLVQPEQIFQIDSMDEYLKDAIWNILYQNYVEPLSKMSRENGYHESAIDSPYYLYFYRIYRFVVGKKIDEFPKQKSLIAMWYKEFYESLEWEDIYNLIYFTIEYPEPVNIKDIRNQFNYYLEKHLSGYTIIDRTIVPIKDKTQIEAITKVLKVTSINKLKESKAHIENSLKLLSNIKNPDYKNSIAESIKAVECICKIIADDDKADLAKALKVIKDKIGLQGALSNAFDNLYGYASNSGIRHAKIDPAKVDSEDAIFMLVSCSAFVSYLISKAQKAGIDFSK